MSDDQDPWKQSITYSLFENFTWGTFLGLGLVLSATVLQNVGLGLMKLVHNANVRKEISLQRPYYRIPRWWASVSLFLVGVLCDVVSLSFLPASLGLSLSVWNFKSAFTCCLFHTTAMPMGGVGLVVNGWFSARFLGEQFTWRERLATVFIVIGSWIAILFSSKPVRPARGKRHGPMGEKEQGDEHKHTRTGLSPTALNILLHYSAPPSSPSRCHASLAPADCACLDTRAADAQLRGGCVAALRLLGGAAGRRRGCARPQRALSRERPPRHPAPRLVGANLSHPLPYLGLFGGSKAAEGSTHITATRTNTTYTVICSTEGITYRFP